MIETLRTLSIEQQIGQLFIVGINGPDIDADTEALLNDVEPGGICLFARNIRNLEQTRQLTDDLRRKLPVLPILAMDQEGGLVDRLRRVLSPMPAAERIRDVREARTLAAVVSEALLGLGLNMDFAPVVDVIDSERRGSLNGLTSRTFGTTKEDATELAGEFLKVLQSEGILGCLKHFPGLGASTVDSHEELPVVNVTEEELSSTDLYPYRELIRSCIVNAIMVGHAAYPATTMQEKDPEGRLLPSSMSFRFVTGLLREQLGFQGLVITDDLEMGAIMRNYGIGEACVRAILAGVDLLAICADPLLIREGFHTVMRAFAEGRIERGRIDESLKRIARTKEKLTAPLPFAVRDLERLSSRIEKFAGQAVQT
jgi:beta-N-acetylhexosaminidase